MPRCMERVVSLLGMYWAMNRIESRKFPTKFVESFLSPWRMHWDHEPRQAEDEHENKDEDEIKMG